MYPNKEEKVLEKYGRDITEAVKNNKIDPVIGRDEEIRNLIRILSRKTKNNPVLIGEPGVEKCEAKPAKEIAHILFDHLNKDYDFSGKRVAMLVNGLGGTPLMELYVLCHEMELLLEEKGIQVANVLVGNHMTALEMAGCSVSLMDLDDELAENICIPCCTPGLKIMAGKEVQGCN